MKYRILTLAFLIAVMVVPAFAHKNAVHHAQSGDFGFDYAEDHVVITHVPTGIDSFPPAPAHTMIEVIHEAEAEGNQNYQATIRLYRTEDVQAFEHYQTVYNQLQGILADRPDTDELSEPSEDLTANAMPVLPVIAEGQTIHAAMQYIENDSFDGMRFITAYQAAVEPLSANLLFYTYQGLSKDGEYVVSVMVWLENDLFPKSEDLTGADVEAFRAQGLAYWQDAVAKLNAAEPDAFKPNLTVLDTLVQSFSITQ